MTILKALPGIDRLNEKNQRGAIMVEAALYFPITIAVVMVVIYLGLFKMQESYFFFQTERAASELAREIAYPGYEKFHDESPLENNRVDFSWEGAPGADMIRGYYNAYNGSLSKIYRWGLDSRAAERAGAYQKALKANSALFSLGSTEAYVKINNGFLSKSIMAEIRYEIPTPGIIRYLGVQDRITIYAAAYQPVMNTTDFVRNVDLAWDMGEFLLEKLGLSGKAAEFAEKFNQIKELIL